jgi:hypothetical protein
VISEHIQALENRQRIQELHLLGSNTMEYAENQLPHLQPAFCLAYSTTMKMDATYISEMSVNSQWTI